MSGMNGQISVCINVLRCGNTLVVEKGYPEGGVMFSSDT